MENKIKITLAFLAVGIIAGYVSSILVQPFLGILTAVILGAPTGYFLQKKFAPEESLKWTLGNGLGTYILVWYAVYTIFFNIGI